MIFPVWSWGVPVFRTTGVNPSVIDAIIINIAFPCAHQANFREHVQCAKDALCDVGEEEIDALPVVRFERFLEGS